MDTKLLDPELPLDNNDDERSIRAFCVGKHSWHIIDSVKGAEASALLYSISESAKANNLKHYRIVVVKLNQGKASMPARRLALLCPLDWLFTIYVVACVS